MMKICNFLRAYNAHKLLYLKRVAERKYLFDQSIGLYQSVRIASFANPIFFCSGCLLFRQKILGTSDDYKLGNHLFCRTSFRNYLM